MNEKKELIKLQGWVPSSLCVTYSGHKMIIMFSDDKIQPWVVRYPGSTEKRMMQFNDKGLPLYNETKLYNTANRNRNICVTECTVNEEVVHVVIMFCVCDLDTLIVLNNFSKSKTFWLPCITKESQISILIQDYTNYHVYIHDLNGQFLRYFYNCD